MLELLELGIHSFVASFKNTSNGLILELLTYYATKLGYEPADLTVPELPRVGLFFLYRCPEKMFSKESLNISELFRFKDPKNVFFQHIRSNPILISLTFLDNNE